ncbi:MAG: VOC family protein [Rhodoferax sp.]|jgi:catechol 2,3-dioxygenase-like lactoylglutathione lyase family enzyme
MFSHIMLGVSDLTRSKTFYDAILATVGVGPGVANNNRFFYRSATGVFAISTPINGEPASHGNGSTTGFAMQSPEQCDAFHAAGVANGGTTCEDPPGYREGPTGKLYLAYLRDPDGNKICGLYRVPKTA